MVAAAASQASQVGEERVTRARTAGYHAGRKVKYEIHRVPPSALCSVKNRYYCVLRRLQGETGVFPRWAATRQGPSARDILVIAGDELGAHVVFHGFGSLAEVRQYCAAAGVPVPPLIP